jgi:integrase/recombinase XerD
VFDEILKYAHHIECYRRAPFAQERSRYLAYLKAEGQSRSRLRQINYLLQGVVTTLKIPAQGLVKADAIDCGATTWINKIARSSKRKCVRQYTVAFICTARKWLRFLGRLEEIQKQQPFAKELNTYIQHLRTDRGLAESTLSYRRQALGAFLSWLSSRHESLELVTPADISAYIASPVPSAWTRATLKIFTSALREFFRYAAVQRWCKPTLAESVDQPRTYRQESLPTTLTQKDVKRLLASLRGTDPIAVRDRAAILLLFVYGFRIGEVRKLSLDDIDWARRRIRLRRPKVRRNEEYPLVDVVAEALVTYLTKFRPPSRFREVFLTIRAPHRPLTIGGFSTMISRHVKCLGLQLAHTGPHVLRHACATHLLTKGFSLSEIGKHLGHRSSEATRIYAKVDMVSLRKVAHMRMSGLVNFVEQPLEKSFSSHARLADLREVALPNLGGLL